MMNKIWYEKNILAYILFPLSLIYRFTIFIRKLCYQLKIFKSIKINIPVIIVGNITVGGTGKTPLLITLVKTLQKQGFCPGVISRGYGGKNKSWPAFVDANSDPNLVGDEAVLIAKNTNAPVMVGPNRVHDALKLIQIHSEINVIISDDGLQHYALERDIEIAVVDSMRRFGNGFCLPAGPLREPIDRLKTVDFVIANGKAEPGEYAMEFVIDEIASIKDQKPTRQGGREFMKSHAYQKIMAVAGIGNPERFFNSLRTLEINFDTKIFPDHHAFIKSDFDSLKADIIVMTEKDAVKCAAFADDRFYVVHGHAQVDDLVVQKIIMQMIRRKTW